MVLDVMLPGQNGISLTSELRHEADLPILLLTALGETDDRVNGLAAGADDYLVKPFDPRELLLRIATILRRTRRRRCRARDRCASVRSPSTPRRRSCGAARSGCT